MSDSKSILHQFQMAVRFQKHATNTITVLLLDEVGLAEHSPDMPLKVFNIDNFLILLFFFFFFFFFFLRCTFVGITWASS
jgi:hypothetical protein